MSRDLLTDTALYRDPDTMRALLDRIRRCCTRDADNPWHIMEVCGGQTFTLSRYRLEELLPPGVRMIHGPGCPVCVTPGSVIDAAVELAAMPEVTLCSFGDMLRVPGSSGSLLRARAGGGDVRLLYSPLDALSMAQSHPERQVVFFAIGFETTTPLYALMVRKAACLGIGNLSLLTALYTVPPAVRALAADPECRIDGLLAAGHVCAVTGMDQYRELAADLRIPVTVTGFEPVDMLYGILKTVTKLEAGAWGAENAYGRVVADKGNPVARADVDEVMEPADIEWRGFGVIPASGRRLRRAYQQFDASKRFGISEHKFSSDERCIASMIMKGLASPSDCRYFGVMCTPDSPVGAPMVSEEGVCAAHYRYKL